MEDQPPWVERHPLLVQQPGESKEAYRAFRVYMQLGSDRSLKQATAELGLRGISNLGNWSTKNDWKTRCAAYDSYVLTAEVDGYAAQMAAVRSFHLEITQDLLTHLHGNMKLWKPGQDPSIRWTQALAVALKSQQQAMQLREESDKPNGVMEQIEKHLEHLAEG
jgi:hypothetical protein